MAKKYFEPASRKSLAGVGNTVAVGTGLEVQTALKPSQIHKKFNFYLILHHPDGFSQKAKKPSKTDFSLH